MYSMIILTWKPIVIHINLFNHTFLFFIFWKGPYWLAHYQTFWNIGHSPIEAPLWTASCKIETNVLPMGYLFTLYTRELTFGKPCGIKMRCYMQRFGGQLGNNGEPHGNTLGTWWKQEKKEKYSSSSSFPEKKKIGPVMSPCWAFHCLHGTFILKTLYHHIWPGLMAWNSPKKERRKNSPLPTPPPKNEKKLVNAFEPFIGCIVTLVSKTVCHHFWPGLIALPKNTLPIARGCTSSYAGTFTFLSMASYSLWRN